MLFLLDENVPNSIGSFLIERGHEVRHVRDLILPGSPDPLVVKVGEMLSATVVTFDRDFKQLLKRLPEGTRSETRARAGRLSFQCKYPDGLRLIEKWIPMIEVHFEAALSQGKARIICSIQESGLKLMDDA